MKTLWIVSWEHREYLSGNRWKHYWRLSQTKKDVMRTKRLFSDGSVFRNYRIFKITIKLPKEVGKSSKGIVTRVK